MTAQEAAVLENERGSGPRVAVLLIVVGTGVTASGEGAGIETCSDVVAFGLEILDNGSVTAAINAATQTTCRYAAGPLRITPAAAAAIKATAGICHAAFMRNVSIELLIVSIVFLRWLFKHSLNLRQLGGCQLARFDQV